MSKAAMNVFSASLRDELKDKNIPVLTVHPGLINNDFPHHALVGSQRLAEQRQGQPSQNSTSSRTSRDAAKDIVQQMKDERPVARHGAGDAPAPMPL
jgi:short-subunit dehydrogenase